MTTEPGRTVPDVRKVSLDEARAMADDGAQLVDVLPHETFLQEHLPGALNVPLAEISTAKDRLDPQRPVVVYCYDHE
jgi:rhodanese-related sulfurtransferase